MASTNSTVLAEFTYDGTQPVPKHIGSVKLSPDLEEIPTHAFQGCTNLQFVIFNKGLQKIGARAFADCWYLEGIEFPSTLVEIEPYAFSSCRRLQAVLLNEGLVEIGEGAFQYCTYLGEITFPSTLIEMDDVAFFGCSGLREVVFHEGLVKIGESAFQGCRSLVVVEFPSTLVEIQSYAFNNCAALREVFINKGLTKIGENVFQRHLGNLKYPLEWIACDRDRADVHNAINEIPHVSILDGEMLISGAPLEGGNEWMACKENLNPILDLIAFIRLKEATAVFELALWKWEMEKSNEVDVAARESCLIGVPGPVKACVLQFFPHNQLD
mmetsp:Transcript_32164/g.68068  ORF Transcript_32164/g.68068 Transcript_32164/m.68068 type:complete len:327 (+) Transcript_32164:135-1115(+)|eukprot:CAMPEP_0183717144 /NCGR_PEP_ID=MMETSP0737-20130205/10840_1 /TAXON_ID=385413 /ORGANISM="Thalassiosira miniscula, Strain CCMP1093" /LENGTH=326 /DNA_ID=CAMNT_0025946527 /DNA_START=114 /DNA_END=1094 /DNA_ORIENTATION=-